MRKSIDQIKGSIRANRFDEAIAGLNEYIDSGEHSLLIFLLLARAWLEKGDIDFAISAFYKAIALSGVNENTWLDFVRILFMKRAYEPARTLLHEATHRYPESRELADLYFALDPAWSKALPGKRLSLRLSQSSDIGFLEQCFRNEDFMQQFHRFVPRHRSSEALRHAIEQGEYAAVRQRAVHWVICSKQGSKWLGESKGQPATYLGLASLVDIQPSHRRAELLIGFPDPIHRAKGLPLEALVLILDFAFNRVGLNKLTSVVYSDNQHSQRSTLACGFSQEGFRRSHLRDPKTGGWLDTYENGLTVGDFRCSSRLACLSSRLLGRNVCLDTPS